MGLGLGGKKAIVTGASGEIGRAVAHPRAAHARLLPEIQNAIPMGRYGTVEEVVVWWPLSPGLQRVG